VSVRSWRPRFHADSTARTIDPHRWLSLAEFVLRGAAVNDHREAVHNVYRQFCEAVDAMAAYQGVSGLLGAYSRLCHVAMMHQEGSLIVSKLLEQKQQCLLLQAGQDAWEDAVGVSVSPDDSTALLSASITMNIPSTALNQSSGSKKRASWRPHVISAWQKCMMCLSLAHSYIALSNMAVASRGEQMTASGPRLRREPSFAQLAGPDQDTSASQVHNQSF
jgi:hypothetical protein